MRTGLPIPGLIDHLRSIAAADYNPRAIAARFGCRPNSVRRAWSRLGRSTPSPEEPRKVAILRSLRSPAPATFAEIAARHGCALSTVSRFARMAGLGRSHVRKNAGARETRHNPPLAVRLDVANLYLSRLLLPCQCANRRADCGNRSSSSRPVYRSPRFASGRSIEL